MTQENEFLKREQAKMLRITVLEESLGALLSAAKQTKDYFRDDDFRMRIDIAIERAEKALRGDAPK